MAATSQGATVSFGGAIASLLSIKIDASAGGTTDCTSTTSTILGSGAGARILKELDCTSVEPAKVSVTFLGAGPFSVGDIGVKNTLSVSGTGFSVSAQAYLSKFGIVASVGEMVTGSAEFQLTGG